MHIDSVYVGTVYVVSNVDIDLKTQMVYTEYKLLKYSFVYKDQYGKYTDLKTKEKYSLKSQSWERVGDLVLDAASLISFRAFLLKNNIKYKENMTKRKILKILDGGKK